MKLRFIMEPKGNGEALYSTERQDAGSTVWIYVGGSCSRDRAWAEAEFERIKRDGLPAPMTVLREVDLDVTAQLAEKMAEEDRINGDAA